MCSFVSLGGSENQSISGVFTICLTSPLHRVDQVVDCCLWNVTVRSYWILAGSGTRCCIRIIYGSYPEHPKHAQWVACPASMLAMQELATIFHCLNIPQNSPNLEYKSHLAKNCINYCRSEFPPLGGAVIKESAFYYHILCRIFKISTRSVNCAESRV